MQDSYNPRYFPLIFKLFIDLRERQDKDDCKTRNETKAKQNGTKRNKQNRNETIHKRTRNDYYLDKLQVLIAKK